MLKVTVQNKQHTVFYIISDHKRKTNLRKLLCYYLSSMFIKEEKNSLDISSKLIKCNYVTNEVK